MTVSQAVIKEHRVGDYEKYYSLEQIDAGPKHIPLLKKVFLKFCGGETTFRNAILKLNISLFIC